jgi:hypothetical protein
MTMNLLTGDKEEERRIDGRCTRRLPIINMPMITFTVCLVGS